MQSLIDKYGSRTVPGGALGGSQLGQLSDAQLKKAAKRYPTDPGERPQWHLLIKGSWWLIPVTLNPVGRSIRGHPYWDVHCT